MTALRSCRKPRFLAWLRGEAERCCGIHDRERGAETADVAWFGTRAPTVTVADWAEAGCPAAARTPATSDSQGIRHGCLGLAVGRWLRPRHTGAAACGRGKSRTLWWHRTGEAAEDIAADDFFVPCEAGLEGTRRLASLTERGF